MYYYDLPILFNHFLFTSYILPQKCRERQLFINIQIFLLRHWKKMKDISGIVPVITQKNNKLSLSLFLSLFFSMRYVGIQPKTWLFARKWTHYLHYNNVQQESATAIIFVLQILFMIVTSDQQHSKNLTFSSSLFYQNFVFYAQAFSLSNTNIHVHCHGHIDSCLLDLPQKKTSKLSRSKKKLLLFFH